MTTLSRVLAWVLAVALVGGLVVLSVAGVPAATAVLVTAAAVVVMIVLGGAVGGRGGTKRAPQARPGPSGSGEGDAGGTMKG